MMVAVFATMFLALAFGRFGHRRMAVTCLIACLFLSIGLFLWEIYSPDYGFRMPWIQTELDAAPPAAPPTAHLTASGAEA